MPPVVDLTGVRFGRLRVIARTENDERGKSRWVCECDCGEQRSVLGENLRAGRQVSCGCYRADQATVHGHARSDMEHPLYWVYHAMKQRCYNSASVEYHNYGGRGISVCDRWLASFVDFLRDMGERPPNPPGWSSRKAYWQLDRTNNDGNYEPSNCRWATPSQQSQNRRRPA